MLELINVSKTYRSGKAVDGVSFRVGPGEILGLIGANGAGKSTCVSMIATITKPDSGQILFDGHDIRKEPDAIRSRLGYVPQDIALYEDLTGRDNMKFWGRSYGIHGKALKEAIDEVCRVISFDDDLLKKRVREYSGGMKRRLNIGVALLHRPDLVILDEPTTGIDLNSGKLILDAIEKLRSGGTAVIYVGHYLEEVERLATHICIMDQGRCRAFASKEELLGSGPDRITLTEAYERLTAAGEQKG